MSEISYQIGRYHYANEGDCVTKVFDGPDGGKRTFKVVLSTAYNAGIIGSEYHGVAVLDDDNRQVVFDQGPMLYNKVAQAQLFQELKAADWPTFCGLVKQQKRYRECMPDINAAQPAYVYPIPDADNWQVMDVEQEGQEDDPYTYPAQRRVAIVQELIAHTVHRADAYSMGRLAWNIKVPHDVDTSGKTADYPGDAQFDERWEQYLKDEGNDVFARAAESALSAYVEGDYTIYPGEMQSKIHLEVEGRMGGWLVLDKIDGVGSLGWDGQGAMEEELMGYSAEDLKTLYKVVRNLDHDVSRQKIRTEMAYQYAFIRSQQEEEWTQELEEAPASPRP